MEIDQLVRLVKDGHEDAARELRDHCQKIAARLATRFGGSKFDRRTLIAIAERGILITAVQTFKPEQGSFDAWAYRCGWFEIVSESAEDSGVDRNQRRAIKQYTDAMGELFNTLRRDPDVKEIALHLGKSEGWVEHVALLASPVEHPDDIAKIHNNPVRIHNARRQNRQEATDVVENEVLARESEGIAEELALAVDMLIQEKEPILYRLLTEHWDPGKGFYGRDAKKTLKEIARDLDKKDAYIRKLKQRHLEACTDHRNNHRIRAPHCIRCIVRDLAAQEGWKIEELVDVLGWANSLPRRVLERNDE